VHRHGKDIVLVNIEADVTVGRVLKRWLRRRASSIQFPRAMSPAASPSSGYVTTLGHEPIVIGKGKNNPLDRSATPDTVAESALRSGKDPFQVASYVDGTKTMFEMTCAANATGCLPMHARHDRPEAPRRPSPEIALEEDGASPSSGGGFSCR